QATDGHADRGHLEVSDDASDDREGQEGLVLLVGADSDLGAVAVWFGALQDGHAEGLEPEGFALEFDLSAVDNLNGEVLRGLDSRAGDLKLRETTIDLDVL